MTLQGFHGFPRIEIIEPWYLAGGLPTSYCVAAYLAKGVDSYTSSLKNLVNPNYYYLSLGSAYPTWNALTGWTFVYTSSQYLKIEGGSGIYLKGGTCIVRLTPGNSNGRTMLGGANMGSLQYRLESDYKQGLIYANISNIGISTTAVPTTGAVCAFSYTGAGVYSFYLNGILDGSGTNSQAVTNVYRIGGKDSAEYFDGIIAAMALYTTILTDAQISIISRTMALL